MYSGMKPQRGKTPGTAKKSAPKRPAPKPPAKDADPVEVFCRIKPVDNHDDPVCIKVLGPDSVLLTATENSHAARTGGGLKETKYSFKQVFDDCCPQRALFEQVALPLVEDVLHGQNALLFAYGITSSGKTHTMMGEPQDPGVLPRCLDVIFNSIKELQAKKYVFKPDKMNGFDVQMEADAMLELQRRDLLPKLNNMNTPKTPAFHGLSREREEHDLSGNRRRDRSTVGDLEDDNSYSVFISFIEIYNKYIYDLLEEVEYDPITVYKAPTSKGLREDNGHNMYVNGAVEVEVRSTEEAYELLEKGMRRRRVAHTNLNSESSRSHSVLNIRVVQAPLDELGKEVMQDKDKIHVSQLSLVDLAGSERAARTGNQGDRIREAGNINNALMHLRSCIEVLRENQKERGNKMVPYRYDRLTHLFKNFFDGDGKVRMIVCVNQNAAEYDETVNVMKFAMVASEVQVARSEKRDFDLGLVHGRRHLKEQLRVDAEKAAAEKAALDAQLYSVPTPSNVVYHFDPFPPFDLVTADDDHTLVEFKKFLHDRINRRVRLTKEYSLEESSFRAHIIEVEREHKTFQERTHELEAVVKSKDSEISRLSKKLKNLERAYEAMNRKNTTLERNLHNVEKELGEKAWKIQMATTEKNRMEQDNKHRMNWLEKNYNKKIEDARRKIEENAAYKLRNQEHRLAKVRHLLDSDHDVSNMNTPMATRSRFMAKSETDLTSTGKTPVPTPRSNIHHRAMTTASSAMSRPVTRSGRAMPPPTKPKPNLKYHRRSKSSHEICLDHNTAGRDPTSALTPSFKKARSVTKLEAQDLKGVDNYLLTTMDVDSEGDIATKYYKGEVLRTSAGGKSVVYNDVEVVKHKSPGDRKRKSDEYPDGYLADEGEVEDKCRIAIEGHGYMKKRVKQSQV